MEKHIEARRKLLRGVVAGGGAIMAGKTLPDNWSRPLVDSVVLPVHAQTSINSFTGNTSQTAVTPDSRVAQLMNNMVSAAEANGYPIYTASSICIKADGPGTVSVDALIHDDGGNTMDASVAGVPVGGSLVPMSVAACAVPRQNSVFQTLGLIQDAHAGEGVTQSIDVQVTSISGSALGVFEVGDSNYHVPFNLPQGDCIAPDCNPPT